MAKKLIDIQHSIESETMSFRNHLENSLNDEVFDLMCQLSRHCKVYIFSGIIRNYFLKINEIRDVDIVLDGNIDIGNIISKYQYRKNSFGGYKITIENTNIDLWFLRNTWALQFQPSLDFELEKYIPNTAFFNFSSIVFSFNENKFIYTRYFARFLRDKKIDLVFAPNADESLCVVNTLYYSDKLKLKLSKKLIKHIKTLSRNNVGKYEETQLRHFGRILYTNEVVQERIKRL